MRIVVATFVQQASQAGEQFDDLGAVVIRVSTSTSAMEETPGRLTAKPSWLITQLAVHAHRLASDGFAEMKARGYHYRILAALHEFGPASQAELARRCNMDRSDIVAGASVPDRVVNRCLLFDQVGATERC